MGVYPPLIKLQHFRLRSSWQWISVQLSNTPIVHSKVNFHHCHTFINFLIKVGGLFRTGGGSFSRGLEAEPWVRVPLSLDSLLSCTRPCWLQRIRMLRQIPAGFQGWF